MGTDLNIGHATAYAYAKSKGYTGTEEQFATELAQFAENAQQVAEDKEAVEQLVNEFLNTTAPAVIQDVTDEGTSQVERVANAGTAQVTRVGEAGNTQIDAVASAGTTQIGLVTAEGTAQVTRVQDKGDEVIDSIPADYTALTQEVSDLNQHLDAIQYGELPKTIIKNSYVTTAGDISPYVGWDRTDYVIVKDYFSILAKSSVASDYNVFYDGNKNKIGENFRVKTTDTLIYIPDGAVYAIFSNSATGMENFSATFETKFHNETEQKFDYIETNFNQLVNSHFNLFDLSTFENGYVWTAAKNKQENSSTAIASPIEIKANVTYYAKNTRLYFCYFQYLDGTYEKLSSTDVSSGTFTPTKDGFAYLTVNIGNKAICIFTDDETLYNSDNTTSFYTPKHLELNIEGRHIYRVCSTREYTSILEGVIAAEQYKDSIVYIDPGTYDMVQEFKTKYGSDYFTSENYLSQENHRGCPLNNGVHVIGYGGVVVTGGLASTDSEVAIGDWSIFAAGDDTNGDNGYGFTIENITIKSTSQHIRYLVHDEYGLTNYNYINKYINIHFIVYPGYVKRCVGGGLGSHGYILIDNCTIEAPAYDATIRGINYHNDANTGALNEIYIKNCYIPNGTVGITWYGQTPATEKSMLYVNNCYLQAEPVKKAETESAPYENVDIVSWCNTIAP